MPAKAVEVKAIFEINTYTATVNVKIDGSAAAAPGTVELKQSGDTKATLTGSSGVYTASVTNGTYSVFVNSEYTEKTIKIDGAAASADIDYYTVSFSATNSGAASGSTAEATAGGTSISSGATVLKGKAVVLTATGAGIGEATSSSYTYA